MNTYRATVITSPGTIELRDRSVPELSPEEVLVRVRFAGICGTDLAIYSGSYSVPLPLVPGHEFVGEVTAVGDRRNSAWIGQNVTAEINNTCLAMEKADPCAACRSGMPNHCQTRTVLGIIGADGAFAEMVTVPTRNLHAIPHSMPLQHATFVEPLAAAIRTFELTPISAGETVVVMGAGRLGVLVCKVASLKGARVVAVSRSPYKLQLARKFGANVLIDAGQEDVRERVMSMTDGLGAHIVVEATGDPNGLSNALEIVRPMGSICLKSTPGANSGDLALTKAVVDEVTIQGSRCGNFGKAIRLMSRYKLDIDALISQVYPLSEIGAALDAASRKFKVLVEM